MGKPKRPILQQSENVDIYAPGKDITVLNFKNNEKIEEYGYWVKNHHQLCSSRRYRCCRFGVTANSNLSNEDLRKNIIENALVLKADGIGLAKTTDKRWRVRGF